MQSGQEYWAIKDKTDEKTTNKSERNIVLSASAVTESSVHLHIKKFPKGHQMNCVKRTLALVSCLVLGGFSSYAQDIKQQEAPIKKVTAPQPLEYPTVQIGKAGTAILVTQVDNGTIGSSSGFFVRQDLIVTNIHVVAGIYGKSFSCSAKSIDLLTQYTIKGVVASDPEHDLVILKVEGASDSVLQLGDSDAVALGENVIAIGTHEEALGEIVKGTINRITPDFFHVRAIFLPGYSGGPVLNDTGKVIGICMEGGETKSLGYVIPSNHLKALLKNIRTQEQPLVKWREEPLIRAYAIVRQGDERIALGDSKAAIEAYDAAIRLKPDFATAYARRAEAKYNLKDYEGAVKDFDTSIRLGRDYAIDYVNRSVVKKNLRNYKGAIKDCDTAIRLDPQNAEAYFIRGNTRSDVGDHKMAIEDYDTAIHLKPRSTILATAHVKRADSKFKRGNNIGAIKDYTEAIRLRSNNPAILAVVHINRGIARFNLGDTEGAIEDYDEAIRLKPKNTILTQVYVHRATAKAKLGNSIGGIKDCDAAIHFSEKDTNFAAYVYSKRASIKLDMGDNKGAIEDSDDAIQLNPELVDAYVIRGDAKVNLGNHNRAIKDYNTAIYLKPDYTEVYHKRGNAKIEIDKTSEAKIDFQTALKLAKSEGTQSLKDKIKKALRLLEGQEIENENPE